MKKLVCLFVLTLSCFSPQILFGGMTFEHHISSDTTGESIITKTNHIVLVAKVNKVFNKNGTNKTPPTLDLVVFEVLRGKIGSKKIKAVWKPFPHDVDWVGEGAKERLAEWEKVPLVGPNENTKWIFVGDISDSVFNISSLGRFPFTSEKLRWAKKLIKEKKNSSIKR